MARAMQHVSQEAFNTFYPFIPTRQNAVKIATPGYMVSSRKLLYMRIQQTSPDTSYILVILLLIPSDNNPLVPLVPLIQHRTKLPRQSQFIARAQNALNVARSDLFIHSRNAGNPAHARNTRHHDKTQHGERADSNKLAKRASKES